MASKHLRIHGRVQGVGYRQSMQTVATRLDVVGWVRNRRDGTVEALVCGPDDRVDQLIDWARQGPAFASVTQVLVTDSSALADDGFTIMPTD